MNKDDFLHHRQEVLWDYEDQDAEDLEYHEIDLSGPPNGSAINTGFQFFENDNNDPKAQITNLPFLQEKKVKRKFKKDSESIFSTRVDLTILIPTQSVVDEGITLNRDNSFIRLPDGKDYTILTIEEQEPEHGTSLTIKLKCGRRQPERCGNDDAIVSPEANP